MIPFSLWTEALWCDHDVVSAPEHEDALRGLFGRPLPPAGRDLDTTAELVPAAGRRGDPCTVAVRVGGRVVGHLSRDDGRRYHPVLARLVHDGFRPEVPCHVWAADAGLGRPDALTGTPLQSRVAVALGRPHMLVPVNRPPRGQYELLPPGAAAEIERDLDDLDPVRLLGPALPPEGEGWVHVTLHTIVRAEEVPAVSASADDLAVRRTATVRKLVEVRLDGHRVGRLGRRTGAAYLPIVQYLSDLGIQTAARAIVRTGQAAPEVVLYAARAHELPVTWPDGLGAQREPSSV